jgi:hypothetical protein
VADAARSRPASAQRLRDARAAWGWSQNDLAAQVEKIRTARGLHASDPESLRRQIIGFEQGRSPGPLWRSLLADALQDDEDRLFGLVVDADLPRPLLVQTPVSSDVLGVILAQRAAHIRAEHLFGPDYARDLVDSDLTTIEELIPVTPPKLRYDVRRAAGRIAELGGWIAQDSGDPIKAEQLTVRAQDHLRTADPALRAMIWMRRSNIQLRSDPELAVELAADAARLIDGLSVGRLAASIARQRALAAIANHNRSSFIEHAAYALEIAQTEPVTDDHAIYATQAYVAAEIASGLIAVDQPAKALALLLEYHNRWPDEQYRDYAVASARLVRALVVLRDYHSALDHIGAAARAYRVAPSDRARRELRHCRKIIRDRARTDKGLPLLTLRRRIEATLQGDTNDD